MEGNLLDDDFIRLHRISGPPSQKVRCPTPECAHHAKGRTDLGITLDEMGYVWQCFSCGVRGSKLNDRPRPSQPRREPVSRMTATPPPEIREQASASISEAGEAFFYSRGISPETLKMAGVFDDGAKIGFPYKNADGQITAIKYRGIQEKKFFQKGVCETYFMQPDKLSGDTLIACEGEVDTLSLIEVGFVDVMSIPNGAPQKVSEGRVDPSEDGKFRYVWSAKSLYDQAKKIILFTDSDEPGKALAEELARRIGKGRCWKVTPPADCKDANDILVKHGPERLKEVIAKAEPWPINGIHTADFYTKSVTDLYNNGTCGGISTGIQCLDKIYTLAPGMLTILTGIPGSGKSSVFDQIMMNVSDRENWKCAVASFENPQPIHIAKLASIQHNKPFFDGPHQKMTIDEMNQSITWINDRFFFLDGDGGLPTIEDVIQRLEVAVMRWGIRLAIIDPFSYLAKDKGMAEHEWVGYALSLCKQWALAHDAHIVCVAHPQKMMRQSDGSSPMPGGYDISGAASYFNKADIGMTVGRSQDGSNLNVIKVWKSRFPWIGTVGQVEVQYDPVSGRFLDPATAPVRPPRIIYSSLGQPMNNSSIIDDLEVPKVVGERPW